MVLTGGKLNALTNSDYSNSNSTPTSVTKFQDRQDIIVNEWAIGRAMEWEMNQSPPDRVSLKSAIAMAQKLKKYALDLDNVSFEDNPF